MERPLWLVLALLAAAPSAAQPVAPPDPAEPLRAAFSKAKPLPADVPDAYDEALEQAKDIQDGCRPACATDEERQFYRNKIELLSVDLAVTDPAAVLEVYCPNKICRVRGSAAGGTTPGVRKLERRAAAKLTPDQRAKLMQKAGGWAKALMGDEKDAGAPGGVQGGAGAGGGTGAVAGAPGAATTAPAYVEKGAGLDNKNNVPTPIGANATVPVAGGDRIPGLPGIVAGPIIKAVKESQAKFSAERDARTEKLAAAAHALLRKENGDAALADEFDKALAIKDAAERAEALRGLIDKADRRLQLTLELVLKAKLREAREKSCEAKKGKAQEKCLAADPSAEEIEAARKKAFDDNPDLGLYFVGRAEHQLFIKGKLADGELWKGLKLSPWEVGAAVPEGTGVTVAAKPPQDKKGSDYVGLDFRMPDGSTRFEGTRPAKGGYERFVSAEGDKGRVEAVVRVQAKGGKETVVGAENRYYDGNFKLVRSEEMTGSGAKVVVKEYNTTGKYAGEPRRVEITEKKNGKTKRTVKDTDAGLDTVLDYDGSFTMSSRLKGGTKFDPKDPKSSSWTRQKGRIVDGKLKLEEVSLADGTVMTGSSDDRGKFSPTAIKKPDGTVVKGTMVEKKGPFNQKSESFEASEVVNADGSGFKKFGSATVITEKGGKKRYIANLRAAADNGREGKLKAAKAVAADFVRAAELPKTHVEPLAEWLADQLLGTTFEPAGGMNRSDIESWADDGDLLADKPRERVYYQATRRVDEVKDDVLTGKSEMKPVRQTYAEWKGATEFKGEKGLALRVLTPEGLPYREYIGTDSMREWRAAYSSKDAGLLTNGKQWEHLFLVQYHRSKNISDWETKCEDVLYDAKKECVDRIKFGKEKVIDEGGGGLGSVAHAIGEMPVIKQAGQVGKGAYYTSVGGIQQLTQVAGADGPNMRMATISNMSRGGLFSDAEILSRVDADEELRVGVEEKVLENRKKMLGSKCDALGTGECAELVNRMGCAEGQTPPCFSDKERMDVVNYAFSPGHAIDAASDGSGSKVLYVLGGLGQAGEAATASLPLMGLSSALGAVGRLKTASLLGSTAVGTANVVNFGLNTVMTAGWVAGGLSNAGEFVAAFREGDTAKAVKTGIQAATDLGFVAHSGIGALSKKDRAATETSLAGERERLETVKKSKPEAAGAVAEAPAGTAGTAGTTVTPPKTGGIEYVLLDLRGLSKPQVLKVKAAAEKHAVGKARSERGLVRIPVRRGTAHELLASIKDLNVEPLTSTEYVERLEYRNGEKAAKDEIAKGTKEEFEAEVDAAFSGLKLTNDFIGVDVQGFNPGAKKFARDHVKALGGKWTEHPNDLITIEVPPGKGNEVAGMLNGAGNVLSEGQFRAMEKARAEENGAQVGKSAKPEQPLWNQNNGSKLVDLGQVKASRDAALKAAETLAVQVAAAEKSKQLADDGFQGLQTNEPNCVPHALANGSGGALTIAETMTAARKVGYDGSDGLFPAQVEAIKPDLIKFAKERGYELSFETVPVETFFKRQAERAAQGLPRQPAFASIRTGIKGQHSLHAVVVRGQLKVGGSDYIVVRDSHRSEPLVYEAQAMAEALVSNNFLVMTAKPLPKKP